MVNLAEDATYVFHERGASFGQERQDGLERGREMIQRRHPGYADAVQAFRRADPLFDLRAALTDALARGPESVAQMLCG
jgi:hypothetical protein